MDDFYWKPDSGVRLDAGPLLTKEYDPAALACEFWNDFIGPCNWLWGLSGVGGTSADSEGKLLRLMSVEGNGDKETFASSEGALLVLVPLYGESLSGAATTGLLNASLVLSGGDDTQQTSGAGLLQEIKLIEGMSQTVSTWRNDYYWPLTQGRPLSAGAPLDKHYGLKAPVHAFLDDFIGPHRDFIMRLRAAAGDSMTDSCADGILAMFWSLIGASEAKSEGIGTLAVAWSLAGDSIIISESTGILAVLWRLLSEAITITDSGGRLLRLHHVSGDSIVLTAGEGTIIKWPLSIELGVEHLGIEMANYVGSSVRLTAEFRNTDGEPEDPGDVILRVYDGRRKIIAEFLVKPYETGKYRHDYTIPGGPLGPLTLEYAGELGDKAKLARARLERVWS